MRSFSFYVIVSLECLSFIKFYVFLCLCCVVCDLLLVESVK